MSWTAEQYAANRERVAEQRRIRRRADPRINERQRAYHLANRDQINARRRERHLMKKYGITPEQRQAMLDAQGGRCAICKTDNPGLRGFHLDHDHKTNKLRGLLCMSCNSGLGHFRDSVKVLAAAITYLEAS